MSKTVAGLMVTALAIVVIGGVVLLGNRNDGNPTTSDHSMNEGETKQSNVDTSSDVSKENQSNSEAVQATTIDIKNYEYAPVKIKVKKGTAVTWTNQDSVRHDITPDEESKDFKASKLLNKGETYTFTFTKAGTYTYHCSPHPYMKGTVEVVE